MQPVSSKVKSWCFKHGWSDPFWHEDHFWAFPPNAVMPLPVPDHSTQDRTSAEIVALHFWLEETEDIPVQRTWLQKLVILGFYLHLISLDLLLLLELIWGFGLILGFPWGDRFSLDHLVVILAFALFWDYILVSIQSQIRFFPFYDRLAHLRESLWLMWVRHTPPFRILSTLCHKGLVGEDWAFQLAGLIWHYRLVLAFPQQRKKTQDKIQAVLNVMERQGQDCRGVRAYLARSIGVQMV